jgi:hypothetical protein
MKTRFENDVCCETICLSGNGCLVCQTEQGGEVIVRRSGEHYEIDETPQHPEVVSWFLREFCRYCQSCKLN